MEEQKVWEKEYLRRTPRSAGIYEEASQHLPGGNTRGAVFYPPYPSYIVWGSGCRLYDVDGNEIIDFLNNYTSLIHGHVHPKIVSAVEEQLKKGTAWAAPTELECHLAKTVKERIRSIELMRFTNSGSEAIMFSLLAARGFSGKEKIAKFEGAYHGAPELMVSTKPDPEKWGSADSPTPVPDAKVGLPKHVLENVIVMPYNNKPAVEGIIKRNRTDLAAVIVDPVMMATGVIPPRDDFLEFLRDVTEKNDVLLIFDEVVSGFRIAQGGAYEYFGVKADLTALGKNLGGGFPVGAFGGRSDIMSLFDPSVEGGPKIPHSGTFNANPITLTAGLATLKELTEEQYEKMGNLGRSAREGLQGLFKDYDVPAQVSQIESLFHVHFTSEELKNHRAARSENEEYKSNYFHGLLNEGIMTAPRGLHCISTPMTSKEIEALIRAAERVIQTIK